MAVSVFDLFKIGIGPSSSHTVGPMRAARLFVQRLQNEGLLPRVQRLQADLYGSLGATGKGHGSDKAVLLGLLGHEPDTVEVEAIPALLKAVRDGGRLDLAGVQRHCVLESGDRLWLEQACERLGLSLRAAHRLLKVARTLADLEQLDAIARVHLAEALQYRPT